jgi:SAM-dependent methyltransferase
MKFNFNSLKDYIYKNPFFGRIFHTLIYCLQKELKNCKSVLDLGCGLMSPIIYCKEIEYSIGVEIYKPYLDESKKKKIHTEYLNKRIEEIMFPDNSFDSVLLIEVLEHLNKETGIEILKKIEKIARKKIIITTPGGYFSQNEVDKNPFQKHLSGWSINDFKKYGYKCRGLAGLRFFYKNENNVESLISNTADNDYLNIKYKPKKLFYLINSFFQIFSYYFPKKSFEIMAVKEKNIY